jgi:hypothetical protein
MAHFAEIDQNNTVLRVIVVENKDTSTPDGTEVESIGVAFCQRLFGGNWVKTSYNGNIRKNYAGVGYTYDSSRDAFISPKPYASWILNEDNCLWDAPVAHPDDGKTYSWNEATTNWVKVTK